MTNPHETLWLQKQHFLDNENIFNEEDHNTSSTEAEFRIPLTPNCGAEMYTYSTTKTWIELNHGKWAWLEITDKSTHTCYGCRYEQRKPNNIRLNNAAEEIESLWVWKYYTEYVMNIYKKN